MLTSELGDLQTENWTRISHYGEIVGSGMQSPENKPCYLDRPMNGQTVPMNKGRAIVTYHLTCSQNSSPLSY